MKKTIIKGIALAFAGTMLMAGSAMALPITGGISLSGGWLPTGGTGIGDATGIDYKNDLAIVIDVTGSFSSLTPFVSIAAMQDFQFNPLTPDPVSPLWSVGGFSFSLDNVVIDTQDANTLVLFGSGTISGTGFDDTLGEWVFTGNTAGGTFSWSDSTAPVPEPATMLLMGSGLAGLAGIARKRRKKA